MLTTRRAGHTAELEPLTRVEFEAKFAANAACGGWPPDVAARLLAHIASLPGAAPVSLAAWRAPEG